MNNEIQKFDFKGAPLRTLTDKAGEPWFVAKDVCDILGTDTRDLHKILESDEITNVDSIHIAQNGGKAPLIISEPGLYRLVMKSRKPEAKEFQRWVTHEVLPSIRKHGGYMAGQERMTPEQMALASMRWLQSKVDEQAKQLKAQEGKVLFANAVETARTSILVGDFAKILKKQRHRHRPTAPVRLAPRAWMAHQGQGLQLEHAHTEGDGPSPVRGQGDDHQPLGRAHHDQQDAEDDRQGADVFRQTVPRETNTGSGCVMIVATKPSALSVVASIICAISGIWMFACGLKSLNQFQILLGCSLLLNGLQIGTRWVMLRELNRNYLLMRRSVLCTEPPREQERESER